MVWCRSAGVQDRRESRISILFKWAAMFSATAERCGSCLACDTGDSVFLLDRGDAIAGKQLPQFGLFPIRMWRPSTEISDSDLRLSLGNAISSLRTPLQTQRSGVAARISSDAKALSCPFSWRFFIVYCAALWWLCAGYLRVCRCSGEPVREPAYSYHPIASRRSVVAPLYFSGASQ